jgi:hypothetical protein
MSRDYFAVVDRIIHPRWTNIRRRVRKALEQAYQDGLNDAADVLDEAADVLTEGRRALRGGLGPKPATPSLGTVRTSELQ